MVLVSCPGVYIYGTTQDRPRYPQNIGCPPYVIVVSQKFDNPSTWLMVLQRVCSIYSCHIPDIYTYTVSLYKMGVGRRKNKEISSIPVVKNMHLINCCQCSSSNIYVEVSYLAQCLKNIITCFRFEFHQFTVHCTCDLTRQC